MTAEGAERLQELPLRVSLLGVFSISCAGHIAGPWPRPGAKRLCELIFVPGRRVTRDLACEALFPGLGPEGEQGRL